MPEVIVGLFPCAGQAEPVGIVQSRTGDFRRDDGGPDKRRLSREGAATAVPQLLYSEAAKAKWVFLQEKPTLNQRRTRLYVLWNRFKIQGNSVGREAWLKLSLIRKTGHGPKLYGLNKKDGFLPHPFDLEHGVRTSGLVAGRHLKTGSPHDRHNTAYYGIAPSVFHSLIRRWRRIRPAFAIEEITFIDIGAGMGRAVLLAAEMPFRAVIGVEMHTTLVRIARRNLTVWRRAGGMQAPVRVVEADAATFPFPDGPCMAFLFNPFGAVVMRRFLSHCARSFQSRPGELDLLYVNHEQEHVLEQRSRQSGFVRYFQGQVKRSKDDAKADHAILTNQPDGEYASADYEDCSIWRWMGKGGD